MFQASVIFFGLKQHIKNHYVKHKIQFYPHFRFKHAQKRYTIKFNFFSYNFWKKINEKHYIIFSILRNAYQYFITL